jgi:hypothetical protein
MSEENTGRNHGGASCCGPEMMEAMGDCPCGSLMKGHRGILYAILAVVVLAFLISQVGGILGIIGFFRTF